MQFLQGVMVSANLTTSVGFGRMSGIMAVSDYVKGPGFEFSLPTPLALDGIRRLLAKTPGPFILGERCFEKRHWTWLTMPK